MSKRKSTSKDGDEDHEGPGAGAMKHSRLAQSTMFKYFKPQKQGESSHSKTIQVTPATCGIKIYSTTEIESASGLKKEYFKFWNVKAAELCQSKDVTSKFHNNKRAIMGAINCSWTLERTKLISLQAEELIETAEKVYADEVKREHLITSVRSNLTRMQAAHASLMQSNLLMCESSTSDKKRLEDDLTKEMSELRLAQEALIKAIQRKKVDIFAAEKDELESELMESGSPCQLSDNDLETLAITIKEETHTQEDN